MITSNNTDHQPLPDPETGKCAASVLQTPISLVVSSPEQTSGCSASCLHEKRIIRRELQKWGKNVVYLVGESMIRNLCNDVSRVSCKSRVFPSSGFESVAQEFVGPRRWRRIASGLPVCPPSTSGRRSGLSPEVLIAEKEETDEPVDWDPEKEDCLNCAFRRSKVTLLNPVSPVCATLHVHVSRHTDPPDDPPPRKCILMSRLLCRPKRLTFSPTFSLLGHRFINESLSSSGSS